MHTYDTCRCGHVHGQVEHRLVWLTHLFHWAHFGALGLDVILQVFPQRGFLLHFRGMKHML